MRLSEAVFALMLTAATVAGGGCTSSDLPIAGSGSGSSSAPEAPKVREVKAGKLPPLGDASPTSDPALQAAGPNDWKRLPRNDAQYLIGWYGGSNPNVLPRIFVRSQEWTGESDDTTRDNLPELTAEIDRRLKKDPHADVLERPQSMILAGEPWVRFVAEAKTTDNKRAEKQILQRVVNGTLYSVELQIYTRKILESRDQAYAVAAGLKFGASAAPTPSSNSSAEPADAGPPAGQGEPPPENSPDP